MRVTVIGVMRLRGVSSKTNNSYDMCRLYCLQPIELRSSEKMTVSGGGYQAAEISLHPDALELFASQKLPCVLELETEMEMQRGQMVPVVTGIKAAKAAA